MLRRSTTVVLCLMLAVAMAACGGGSDEPSDAEGNVDIEGSGGGDDVRRVLFVPDGPRDDSTPVGNQWYEFLTEGRCGALREDADDAPPNDPPVIIYQAAAAACTGEYEDAEAGLNRYLGLGIPIEPEDCGRAFVIEFIQNVLRVAESAPDASIDFVSGGRRPPCERNDDTGGGGTGGEGDTGGTTTTAVRRGTTTTRPDTTG